VRNQVQSRLSSLSVHSDYAEDDDRSTTADDAHVDRTPTFGAEQSQSQDFGLRNWAHTGSQVYVQSLSHTNLHIAEVLALQYSTGPMPFKRVYITPSNEAENSKAEEFTSVIAPKPTLRKVRTPHVGSCVTRHSGAFGYRYCFWSHTVQEPYNTGRSER
jgi:hypothetical protein